MVVLKRNGSTTRIQRRRQTAESSSAESDDSREFEKSEMIVRWNVLVARQWCVVFKLIAKYPFFPIMRLFMTSYILFSLYQISVAVRTYHWMKRNLIFNLDLIHFRNFPKIFFSQIYTWSCIKNKLLNRNQVRTAKQLSLET